MRPFFLSTNSPISRRLFIVGGLLSGIGSLVFIFRGLSSFLQQPASSSGPIKFSLIAKRDLLQGRSFMVYRQGIWLIQDDQGWYGLKNNCTHLGCRLNWDLSKKIFICPCHGSRFNLQGEVIKGPTSRPLSKPYLYVGWKDEIWVDSQKEVDRRFRLRL